MPGTEIVRTPLAFSLSYQINLSKVKDVSVTVFLCVETRSAQYKTSILTGSTLVT